jgi:hypothetical protein
MMMMTNKQSRYADYLRARQDEAREILKKYDARPSLKALAERVLKIGE